MKPSRLSSLLLAVLCSGSLAHAQWSSDPTLNLPLADASGDQILPKVVPTANGGAYVSWFDSIANGFDVRLQRLNAAGVEMFAHGGVLVADRGFSSVQDYGLDVDASGNALLSFRDDGGVGVQITAAKVSPSGTLIWGAGGVQLTSTTDFVAAPKIAGTADGGTVVAWTQNSDTRLQKLDASGSPLRGAGVTLSPGAGSYSVSDMHDAGSDAILGFVHQTGGFGSPRHLLAQKFDIGGNPQWGAAHVAVFDGGSLQFGNFPSFVPDQSGGAVFSWYDASSAQLQCYAQRILSAGTEAFAHNGTPVSTNLTRVRVSPAVAFAPSSSETFVFWVEQNSAQSQFGLYAQKLNGFGNRQWTDDGSMLIPLGSSSVGLVRTLTAGSGAFVFWDSAPSFGQDQLFGARLDATGAFDIPAFDVSSVASGKLRLSVAKSTAGVSILAWGDNRNDAGDVLAQNVNADGSLGIAAVVPTLPPFGLALLALGLGALGLRSLGGRSLEGRSLGGRSLGGRSLGRRSLDRRSLDRRQPRRS